MVSVLGYMVKKPRSIAFQRCIWRGGLHLVEISQNEDFLQKNGQKTAFWEDTNLDKVTSEQAGTPNFKSINIFESCDENMGHNGQNEPWASLLASILSDRQPLENFYQEAPKKCQKRQFSAFRQIYWDFACATYIQGTTIWKLTSWRLRKCIT